MSTLSADDFARLLYSRLPEQYRARDAERNLPLLALMRVVGEQASYLRQDLDHLWDNFFIETCDDWVVPYLGKLLGTRLLAHPVGQSDRLDVWNTVAWRRSKGTPTMLAALSTAITEWQTDPAEFFQQLGWSQNVNHPRPSAVLTADLRDPYALSLLGRANDALLHAPDFKPSYDLDQPRTSARSLGIGRFGWATPGRYAIKNVGFFVRRLKTFPVHGGTPSAAAPGIATPANASCFTFDPLHRPVPLFSGQNEAPITRADFAHAPWTFFGSDVAVRQWGVLLARATAPQAAYTNSGTPATFGAAGSGLALDAASGMQLVETADFQAGGVAFVLTAGWQQDNGVTVDLGALNTSYAALGIASAFHAGAPATDGGALLLSVELAGPGTPQWTAPPFSGQSTARFPGAVVALRAAGGGPVRAEDGLYVYLPAVNVSPGSRLSFYTADDGSTYYSASLSILSSAREAEGQVYPPFSGTPSAIPALNFTALGRGPNGLTLPDRERFGGAGTLYTAELFTGAAQTLGAIGTIAQSGADFPLLDVPAMWPAFTYGTNLEAVTGAEVNGMLDILVQPLGSGRVPPAELIFTNRSGESLLIYLPGADAVPAGGLRFFVADDGGTYYFPADPSEASNVLSQTSLAGLTLARAAAGQSLAIPGVWPLRQRRPVALNLCRCERTALLQPGELGIDPETGQFGFAPGDPAIGAAGLSVDYVEAFGDGIGAVNFDRQLNRASLATQIISSSGDADTTNAEMNARIYTTLAAALAESQEGGVLEFADSATYTADTPAILSNAAVRNLTIRAAAGQRPCLAFYTASGAPATASLLVTSAMANLALNGLLFSGGPVILDAPVAHLELAACTLDPTISLSASLLARFPGTATACSVLLCRCITGGLQLCDAVVALTVADSIIDAPFFVAISSDVSVMYEGPPPSSVSSSADDTTIDLFTVNPRGLTAKATVQLERVTVLGQVFCTIFNASESLLNDWVFVEDQQSGCVRFCRYERGSVLPGRFQCVPSESEIAAANPAARVLPPLFNSRRFGRPSYLQLASACSSEILTASESAAEVGAFASTLNTIRLSNLAVKLQEFMPVGLTPVIIAET